MYLALLANHSRLRRASYPVRSQFYRVRIPVLILPELSMMRSTTEHVPMLEDDKIVNRGI